MPDMKWTENQYNAIKARAAAPIIVSAAAGSGKTAVLVERVIDIITDTESPTDIDRLLVVTFTKAAAAEMKSRIAARLDKMLHELSTGKSVSSGNADLKNRLRRQQLLLPNAHISTIDSFCSELVREFFYVLDIPRDFRVADEQELNILKDTAMRAVLERRYSAAASAEKNGEKSAFANAVDFFSDDRDDTQLQNKVLALYDYLMSQPFPRQWAAEKKHMYTESRPADETPWGRAIFARARELAEHMKSTSEMSLKLLSTCHELDKSKYGDCIRGDAAAIDTLTARIENGGWNGVWQCVEGFSLGKLFTPRGYAENEVKIVVSGMRDSIKEDLKELKKLFFQDESGCAADIAELAPVVSELLDITLELSDEFATLKRDRSLVDFSDMEHMALRLLAENSDGETRFTETAHIIASRFDRVMVDEYQDVNRLQDAIFKAVSDNDRKLFVVGDVKQSIYRFRQAMPEIFIERIDSSVPYAAKEKETAGTADKGRRIVLDRNFRSSSGVVQAVNFIFENLMSRSVGEIDYDENEHLVFGRGGENAIVPKGTTNEGRQNSECAVMYRLLNLDKSPTGDADVEEAGYIGGLIRDMIDNEEISDGSGSRKLCFGDFCILMRGVKTHGQRFVKELTAMGIPAVCETTDSFFDAYEIQVMLSLLRVIDNPVQDIPLAAVMISPIFGFTPTELAQYRADKNHGSLYSAVLYQNKQGNEKTIAFTERIAAFRRMSHSVAADVILDIIYKETSYPEIVSACEDGDFKRANLIKLLQYAKDFENNGYRGIGSFIRFLDRVSERGSDLSAADRRPTVNGDAVRIITIHKSKGLEFPVCIVANLNRKIRTSTTDEVLLHNELGIGVRRKDKERLCRMTTMPREAVALEIKRGEMSEELRVLYVALTRAREKLVLVASVKSKDGAGLENEEKNAAKAYLSGIAKNLFYDGAVPSYTAGNVKTLCDWITQCALVHPSGSVLRARAGYIGKFSEESTADWDIQIVEEYEREDLRQTKSADEPELTDVGEKSESEYCDILNRRLSARYSYDVCTRIPTKVTASALAHEAAAPTESEAIDSEDGVNKGKSPEPSFISLSKPSFMQDSKPTGTQRGTALHTFVQYCDFGAALRSTDGEIARLCEQGFITPEQTDMIDRGSVEAFLHSQLMEDMLSAKNLWREYKFTVELPAGEAIDTLPFPESEELIVLQGAVDCVYEENGKAVVVDYKTDRVKHPRQLADMYAKQLKLYRYAVEQSLGLEVEKCLIYSFKFNTALTVSS